MHLLLLQFDRNYTLIFIPLNDGLNYSCACFISDMRTYSLQTGRSFQHDPHLLRAGTSADSVLPCGLWRTVCWTDPPSSVCKHIWDYEEEPLLLL